ncbi:uncharacterized protein LOC113202805 isoform X2 [Frankliniella occidentalis]|uniref:Uncharacterized protein LOC113202805 isoform X2 n=1 Tax=Frankliniella occidentalis TaxID=133901 RepID=A0A9C6TZY5_FRAOC|nr:uncharacterized protein LOC113202805 isoform X2 [Frankliniella occidentalis]
MHRLLGLVVLGLLLLHPARALPDALPPAQYDWPESRESGVLDDGAVRRTYRLEDFLWTGSGDGEVAPSPRPYGTPVLALTTTTVYKTTTATTTVLATPTPLYTTSLIITQVPRSPIGPITPTASFPWPGEGSVPSTATPYPSPTWTLLNGSPQDPDEAYDDSLPGPRYWLVTVLKANDTQDWHLATDLLESRLARLYKAAFLRQQERHLGIVNASALAALARLRRAPDVVRVTVHNVTTLQRGGGLPGAPGAARLLYWVRVRGRPVPAATAAHDMRLISDHEMAAELGLPIITKAEPYLHAPVPLAARGRSRDAWLLVGAAGCGVALLLLMLALAGAALSQRSRAARRRRRVTGSASSGGAAGAGTAAGGEHHGGHGAANRRRHFHGRDNKGFMHDEHHHHKRDKSSPGFLGVAGANVPHGGGSRLSGSGSGSRSSFSCASSCSGSGSGSSSDAALVRRRGHPHGPHQQGRHQHHQALHHAVNPALVDTLHLTEDDVVVPHPRGTSTAAGPGAGAASHHAQVHDLDVLDAGTSPGAPVRRASPNSYLSMPSVKQFPRGANMPEPLTMVLDPVSISHLDGEDSVERVAVSPPVPAHSRPILRPPPPRQAVTAPVRAPPSTAMPRALPARLEDLPHALRAPAPAPAPAQQGRELARAGVRHSSLEGDPGVLGPVVWGLRCQRLTSTGSAGASDGSPTATGTPSDGTGSPPQAGRMRRRFHELLDDAFSLFAGSRSASRSASQASQDEDDSSSSSPPPPAPPAAGLQISSVLNHVLPGPPPEHRVQSAVLRPVGAPLGDVAPRPKTSVTDARRPSTASGNSTGGGTGGGPRGAWGSDQAVARPLSAGPFHRPQLPTGLGASAGSITPRIDTAVILADARLPPHDPAVPLIAAIKHELSKFGGPAAPGGGRARPGAGGAAAMPLPGYTPPKT